MKHARAWTFGMAMLGLTGLAAQAASEMVLDQVLQEGSTKYLDHPAGILLREGFWAKAGADVTMRIDQTPGYSIDKTPLDPKDPQYTVNDSRMFVVAGCVPKNLPHPGVVGSVWVACNDLDFAKDKVVESAFISCLDLFRNGVVSGASVKEINNRTWESFRFSCSDLAPGGGLVAPAQKADFLFNFEREGKLYEASAPDVYVMYGIKEYWNSPPGREALASFALMRGSAPLIFEGKTKDPENSNVNYFHQTEVIPGYPPAVPLAKLRTTEWACPPGMVLTGAAIGHIPDRKGNDTRPVYILAECRKLLRHP